MENQEELPNQICPRTSRGRVWQKEWERMPWDHTRRTVATETEPITSKWQNEKFHNKREVKTMKHRDYQVFYYGSNEQREKRKAEMRKEYKDWLDKTETPQQKFVKEVEESKRLAEEDKVMLMKEKDEQQKHKSYLSKFRDENKMLIELHAEQRKAQRQRERYQERELLSHNPINWSCSLW